MRRSRVAFGLVAGGFVADPGLALWVYAGAFAEFAAHDDGGWVGRWDRSMIFLRVGGGCVWEWWMCLEFREEEWR